MNSLVIQLKRRKEEFLQYVAIIGAAWLIGMVIVLLVCKLGGENSYITLGSLFGVMVMTLLFVFGEVFSFLQEFNLAISMGQIRRNFVWMYQLVSAVEIAILVFMLFLMHKLELLVYGLAMQEISPEFQLDVLFQLKYVIPAIIGTVAVEMLLQALFLRFGMKAFWGIWFAWMLVCIAPTRLLHNEKALAYAGKFFAPVIGLASNGGLVFWMVSGLLIIAVMMGIAWNMLRKQRVTV